MDKMKGGERRVESWLRGDVQSQDGKWWNSETVEILRSFSLSLPPFPGSFVSKLSSLICWVRQRLYLPWKSGTIDRKRKRKVGAGTYKKWRTEEDRESRGHPLSRKTFTLLLFPLITTAQQQLQQQMEEPPPPWLLKPSVPPLHIVTLPFLLLMPIPPFFLLPPADQRSPNSHFLIY